jgi:hypothetical protein
LIDALAAKAHKIPLIRQLRTNWKSPSLDLIPEPISDKLRTAVTEASINLGTISKGNHTK